MSTLILATRDEAIAQHVQGAVYGLHKVQRVADEHELNQMAPKGLERIILMDPRFFGSRDVLENWLRQAGDQTVIVLSHPDEADPRLNAIPTISTFMAPNAGLAEIQTIIRLATQNASPGTETRRPSRRPMDTQSNAVIVPAEQPHPAISFATFLRSMRHHTSQEDLLEKILDGMISATGVARAGLVLRDTEAQVFRIHGHRHALPSSLELEVSTDDPFIQWFEQGGVPLMGDRIPDHLSDAIHHAAEQLFAETGADIMVPILHLGSLLGWIFLGRRSSGSSFSPRDFDDLTAMADHLVLLIENAQLRKDLMIQKALGETLMEYQPIGIISCDSEGIVRWYNTAAERCLGIPATSMLGYHKDELTTRVNPLLTDVLDYGKTDISTSWNLGKHANHFTATAHRLEQEDGILLGAVAFITDHTAQKRLIEKEEDLKWLQFLRELGASISHELYNPLTPISVFTAMLEEKHDDADYRAKFVDLTEEAISKIKRVVNKINELSSTPAMNYSSQDILPVLDKVKEYIQKQAKGKPTKIEYTMENDLPKVEVDAASIRKVLEHLALNALEAVENQEEQHLRMSIRAITLPDGNDGISIAFSDNGPGIAKDDKGQIFSPFYSTKARGIGLGMPIARRIVTEHHGHLTIDTSPSGTTVTVMLPRRREN